MYLAWLEDPCCHFPLICETYCGPCWYSPHLMVPWCFSNLGLECQVTLLSSCIWHVSSFESSGGWMITASASSFSTSHLQAVHWKLEFASQANEPVMDLSYVLRAVLGISHSSASILGWMDWSWCPPSFLWGNETARTIKIINRNGNHILFNRGFVLIFNRYHGKRGVHLMSSYIL